GDGHTCGSDDPSETAPREVHRGPVQIPDGVVHHADAIPSLPDPEESVLQELLRFVAAPRHHVQRPEEAAALSLEEELELQGVGCPVCPLEVCGSLHPT